MGKMIDADVLLKSLQLERAALDSAITVFARILGEHGEAPPKRSHHKKPDGPKREGRVPSAAERERISRKVRAWWKQRKAAEKKG
ncbi:MAG: hypothetical protein WCA20_13905 [Candidatus Sulfotelmatobacter sp.]